MLIRDFERWFLLLLFRRALGDVEELHVVDIDFRCLEDVEEFFCVFLDVFQVLVVFPVVHPDFEAAPEHIFGAGINNADAIEMVAQLEGLPQADKDQDLIDSVHVLGWSVLGETEVEVAACSIVSVLPCGLNRVLEEIDRLDLHHGALEAISV